MSDPRVRREIALRAAQLMYAREESEYFTAKRKAARMVGGAERDLPSNAEIRDQILLLASFLEGESRQRDLREMRLEALRLMRSLRRFRPRLIGSVLTGHVRKGSDIDLHIFSDSESAVTDALADLGLDFVVQHKQIRKRGEERVFTHIHVAGRFGIELTLYTADKANYPFKSSITGKTMERATIEQVEALLVRESPGIDLDAELERTVDHIDPFDLYAMLLRPLEGVKQNPRYHPEGDALYHSLQVFDLARRVRGFDEEFLLAALLHDVGKAIDPREHAAAAVESLEGAISPRTAWLIEHHMEAHALADRTLGVRARRRLSESDDYDDLLLLAELDKAGRVRGVVVPSVEEALECIRTLSQES